MTAPAYVRFQAPDPNHRGLHVGVFGLVNTLAKRGELTEAEELFRRENNAWYDAHFTNPADVDAAVYDWDLNPGATAWFRTSAERLLERISGYLAILEAHGVACERATSNDPGRVIYRDAEQVVVVPHERP